MTESELQIVRQQLAEAHATLDAIRTGQVDAVLVELGTSPEVFTLERADLPYREFLEQMEEGAISLDRGLNILFANRFFAELVRAQRQDVVGKSFLEVLAPDAGKEFEELISRGEVAHLSTFLVSVAGEEVSVRLAIVPAGTRGNRRHIVVVSDRRDAERLRREIAARGSAEAASHAKDRFLAVLGHELRNPLAALTTSHDLLIQESLGEKAKNRVLRRMTRQLHQLQSLIDDLLDLSRIVHGKVRLKKTNVRVRSIVRGAVGAVVPAVHDRQQDLIVSPLDDDLFIYGDQTRLEQVVVNLLSNASKYTPPGGEIRVDAAHEEGRIFFEVADSGAGLDRAELDRVFEPFVQVGQPGEGGLGIGLTLVRQLVELHDGKVSAESAGLGCGTTMRVVLPQGDVTPASSEPVATSIGAEAHADLRVLVVDDNEDAAELLSMLLASKGADVVTAHDGPEALEALERHTPRLALLDLGLPGMSGYEVAAEIRRRGHREMVLVALTGFSHSDARSRVREAGFDEHVLKPLRLAELQDLIERFRDRLGQAG